MKIKRVVDGKEVEFELSKQELYEAYAEQEFQWDLEYVKTHLDKYSDEEFLNKFGYTRSTADPEAIASEMRRQMNKYELDIDYAFTEAICECMP